MVLKLLLNLFIKKLVASLPGTAIWVDYPVLQHTPSTSVDKKTDITEEDNLLD